MAACFSHYSLRPVFLSCFIVGLSILLTVSIVSAGNIYTENPDTYLTRLKVLQPGDRMLLLPGEYKNGLPIHFLRGKAEARIVISGPGSGPPAIFVARPGHNTISINNSNFITIRNLEIDGRNQPVDGVKCEGHADWAHHITLENLLIHGHSRNQQTVGISTKCPAWNWTIRKNTIRGAGTGIYLGNSDGRAPFIAGLIEYNLVTATTGYNLQIKHQLPRPLLSDMPRAPSVTIIRHNVFSKAEDKGTIRAARPNVLVGHWPLSGTGQHDKYLIYGNFFYQNAHEALLQGEGNLAVYNNLFVNHSGDAIRIQPHHDIPRKVDIFFNTILAANTGIYHAGFHNPRLPAPWISDNAVFAKHPLIIAPVYNNKNILDTYQAAADYLQAPFQPPGTMNLAPRPQKLLRPGVSIARMQHYPEWNLDFSGYSDIHRIGAYARSTQPEWLPNLEIKPENRPNFCNSQSKQP